MSLPVQYMTITIDPEFRALIPPLTPEEFAQLEENIKRDGCRDPLVVWNDTLVDGHNRYAICNRLPAPFTTTQVVFKDRTAAKIWIIDNQFGRRNLQKFVRAELLMAREKLLPSRQGYRSDLTSVQNGTEVPLLAPSRQAAKLADIPHTTYAKAKVIAEKAPEPVKEKLRSGQTSIDAEYRKIRLQERDDRKKQELQLEVEITSPGIIIGDFREKSSQIADNSVELVFIDPPYDRESLGLYEDSARIAARILKPGGSLIAYCGQYLLPEILPSMQKHLRYWWMNACVHDGQLARMESYGVVVGWKPLAWFTKGVRGDKQTFVSDIVSGGREKSHHEWQQSEAEAAYYIEKLTSETGLVVDFFCGGGTTCVAAHRLERPWVAFEINPATAKKADERLAAL